MTDKIFPVALRLWLVFILTFLVLGYAIAPSIVFGAIGGFAGGTVSAWWQTPGGEPEEVPAETSDAKGLGRIGEFSEMLRPTRLQRWFPFLKILTRRDRRYPRSRRM